MIVIRTGSIVDTVATITGLANTLDLEIGMKIYGNGIDVDTKIVSIDTSSQITMDKDAVSTDTISLQFTFSEPGTVLERNCALIDAKNIIDERGQVVKFLETNEVNISRDSYNSYKKKTRTTVHDLFSYPITFTPSRRAIELAGLREETEVLIYTSNKDWIDKGFDISDIDDERWNVKLNGKKYEVKEKGFSSQFLDTFLYITFGLFKL